jgi:hypothetical protein
MKKSTKKEQIPSIDPHNILDVYKAIIMANSGVLYLKGKPGIGKTAVFRSMAEKNGWDIEDIRLAQIDETEVAGMPRINKHDINGVEIEVMTYAVPEYLIEANEKAERGIPTLIVFDEINRAPLAVRNAALKLLNERECGKLKLHPLVYMVALGNLGDADGCEVEELDMAMNGRMIHQVFDMPLEMWKRDFADKNVHPLVVSFLEANRTHLYKNDLLVDGENESETQAYASHRSWTNLSNLLIKTYGFDSSPQEIVPLASVIAGSYVGGSAVRFIKYLGEVSALTINDILKDWKKIKSTYEKMVENNRDKKSELIGELKKIEVKKLSIKQVENLVSFLETIDPDEQIAYLNSLLENGGQLSVQEIKKNNDLQKLLKPFKPIFKKVRSLSGNGSKAKPKKTKK